MFVGAALLQPKEDVIFATDIEKAIQYSLMTEVPTQPILNHVKLQTFYRWIESIIRYAPVRREILQFLVAIRSWMFNELGKSEWQGEDLIAKLEEFSNQYQPFNHTPDSWEGTSIKSICYVSQCIYIYIYIYILFVFIYFVLYMISM